MVRFHTPCGCAVNASRQALAKPKPLLVLRWDRRPSNMGAIRAAQGSGELDVDLTRNLGAFAVGDAR